MTCDAQLFSKGMAQMEHHRKVAHYQKVIVSFISFVGAFGFFTFYFSMLNLKNNHLIQLNILTIKKLFL